MRAVWRKWIEGGKETLKVISQLLRKHGVVKESLTQKMRLSLLQCVSESILLPSEMILIKPRAPSLNANSRELTLQIRTRTNQLIDMSKFHRQI